MEVVCGEETKNSVDEKQQTIHACKEFNNDNQGLATQASEPDEARMVTDNQPSKINLVPESLKPVKAPEVTRASDAASIQESRDRRPLAGKFAHHNSSLKECALCGATKTPMWRSGPQGPKVMFIACLSSLDTHLHMHGMVFLFTENNVLSSCSCSHCAMHVG